MGSCGTLYEGVPLCEDRRRSNPRLDWAGVLMCSKGSCGDRRPLEVGLKVGVSCRDNDGVTPGKERPEKDAGC